MTSTFAGDFYFPATALSGKVMDRHDLAKPNLTDPTNKPRDQGCGKEMSDIMYNCIYCCIS